MTKVMTVVGTRPEIIKLSRVIALLKQHVEHVLVHTGQNYDYELNQIFFEQLGMDKPDYYLDAAKGTAAETIGNIIGKIDAVLEKEKPDALLVLGDTNSCMSVIAAKRRKIPIFHIEGGNRCFDQRVPEEINRKIIDHLSDINLVYSDIAREHLLREGIGSDRIIKTGSPMYEILHSNLKYINESNILDELMLVQERYFVISAHREENVDDDDNLRELAVTLDKIAWSYGLPVIVSTHPRTKKRLDEKGIKFNPLVRLIKPLGFFDYVHLQMHARATLSDSGTITEESSILSFPALNLRNTHERPEGMEEGSVIMTGLKADRIFDGLAVLVTQPNKHQLLRVPADYNVTNFSDKVLRIILSYIDYVNFYTWHKRSS